MRSSRILVIALAATASLAPALASAQSMPQQQIALDRYYASAPGGGWFVLDALDMRGGLGGDVALTVGYARNPLRVTDGVTHLGVVSEQSGSALGLAVTYDRLRLYLDLTMPLLEKGAGGTVGGYSFTAPNLDLGTNPDTLSDPRIGFDARLVGDAHAPFRVGLGAQLFVPNVKPPPMPGAPQTSDLGTDGTLRAMGRVLFAGDVGALTYAAHVGVHVRPKDDTDGAGIPRGSELLFGVAAGPRFPLGGTALVVGPEVWGATAFRSFFDTSATALESLLGVRLEGTGDDGAQLRVKLGAGPGLSQHFGAPEWRAVFGVEMFDHGQRTRI
jgi:hypothetical protein